MTRAATNSPDFAGNPKELLTHIIKKAKRSGFSFRNFLDHYDTFIITTFNVETGRLVFALRNEQELRLVYDSIYTLFFDMDFARALFGDKWEWHLVKLAAAKDKLQYLSDNLQIIYSYDTEDRTSESKTG